MLTPRTDHKSFNLLITRRHYISSCHEGNLFCWLWLGKGLNVCYYLSNVWEQTVNRPTYQLLQCVINNTVPPKRKQISRIFVDQRDYKFDKKYNNAFYFRRNLCAVLVLFLLIVRPIVLKIAASREFLGGLAAFFFTAGCRLAAIFTAGGRLT